MFKQLVALVAFVAVLVTLATCVSAMSPFDAYQDARRHHANDPNFIRDNYNVAEQFGAAKPGLKGGRIRNFQNPIIDTLDMPHSANIQGRMG